MLQHLETIIKPIVEGQGHELVEISLKGKGSKVLKVLIFNPEGLNLDQIAKVSKMISMELDVKDTIHSKYYLEVSSPGLDRPLKNLQDFKRTIGENITVWDREGTAYDGELTDVERKVIFIESEENDILEFDIKNINYGKIQTKY